MKRKNTRNPLKSVKTPRFNGRVERYVVSCSVIAAGAATIASPNQAVASIQYSGPLNAAVVSSGSGIYLDLESPFAYGTASAVPGWDVNVYAGASKIWTGSGRTIRFEINNPTASIGITLAKNLGDPVNSSITDWQGANGESTLRVGTSGGIGTTNYAAFYFTPTSGSGVHYGWLQYIRGDKVSNSGSIVDFAWNDVAGAPINVGQTTAVPEPSSVTLLAAGMAGLALWRRRRRRRQLCSEVI